MELTKAELVDLAQTHGFALPVNVETASEYSMLVVLTADIGRAHKLLDDFGIERTTLTRFGCRVYQRPRPLETRVRMLVERLRRAEELVAEIHKRTAPQ